MLCPLLCPYGTLRPHTPFGKSAMPTSNRPNLTSPAKPRTANARPPLPPGWVWTTLGEVANFIRGVSYRKPDSQEKPAPNYVPVLRATNIQNDKLVLNQDLVFVPETYIKPEQYLRPNDIIICISSGSKRLVGKAALLEQEWRGAFGTFLAVARPNNRIEAKYLGYFFSSPYYRRTVQKSASGININNLHLIVYINLIQ